MRVYQSLLSGIWRRELFNEEHLRCSIICAPNARKESCLTSEGPVLPRKHPWLWEIATVLTTFHPSLQYIMFNMYYNMCSIVWELSCSLLHSYMTKTFYKLLHQSCCQGLSLLGIYRKESFSLLCETCLPFRLWKLTMRQGGAGERLHCWQKQ